jgi:N-methylhydantoinase B
MEWGMASSRSGWRSSLPATTSGRLHGHRLPGPGNFNAVEAVTRSCLYYAVRVATDPTIPANGGCYRNIGLEAPAGAIVNAVPPAAVAAGNVETSQRIADVVLGALAQAAPDRVPAAGQGTMNNVLVGNDDFAYYETIAGGQGGRPGRATASRASTPA